MHRANSFIVVTLLLGAASLVAVGISISATQDTAEAQQAESAKLQLTESRNSGVSGTATLEDVEGGVEVELDMRGLPEAGVEHLNHFHGGGTCADDRAGNTAPVTIPLTNIVAEEDGTGSVTTTIEDVTLEQLFEPGEERFILVHAESEEGGGIPPGIACADLVAASEGEATMRESTQPLPKSGGTPVGSVLLPAAALLVGSGALGYAVLRRR